jgi:copper chaperone CopZ
MQQAKMKIEGMHGASASMDIKKTLMEREGVHHATVDFDGKTAFVEFDENIIQPQTLVKLIQDLGYNASLSTAAG